MRVHADFENYKKTRGSLGVSDASEMSSSDSSDGSTSSDATSTESSSVSSASSDSDDSVRDEGSYSSLSSSPEARGPPLAHSKRKQKQRKRRKQKEVPAVSRKRQKSGASHLLNRPRPLETALSIRGDKSEGVNYNLLRAAEHFVLRDIGRKPSLTTPHMMMSRKGSSNMFKTRKYVVFRVESLNDRYSVR